MANKPIVLITGASSGIGKALVFEFARHGYDLVLVSRNEAALQEIADRVKQEHSALARVCAMDLSEPAGPRKVLKWVAEQRISVSALVNNAGFGVQGAFLDTSLSSEAAMVNLQIQATLELTKGLLPPMVKAGSGGILNIASVYSFSPVPHQSVYGACKAFMLSFGEALAVELESTGVNVTTICPGVTQTEFRRNAGMTEKKATSGVTPEHVAELSYAAFAARRRLVVPGLINKVFVEGCRILPMTWISGAVKKINGVRGIHE